MKAKSLGILLLAIIVAASLSGQINSAYATSYVFTTIDVPWDPSTSPYGINDFGHIVGSYGHGGLPSRGFIYIGGSFTMFEVPGASDTLALGINNSGDIVGVYYDATGEHGFLYEGGTFTTIDFPGASETYPAGINDSGHIVGYYWDATGQHGFLYVGGTFTTIDVPGAYGTGPGGINESGQIVGAYGDATGSHGFVASPVPEPFIISGAVTGDVQAGVTMTLSGPVSKGTITDFSGNYSFSALINGTYNVTPNLAGYTFEPPSWEVTISDSDMTGVDFVSFATKPDLIETSVSNPPAIALVGSIFSVTDTVKNQGDADAGASTTRYYLSLDTTKSRNDKLLIGNRSVPALAVGATSIGSKRVWIPLGTAANNYYLLACSDDKMVVSESKEANNCIASSTTMQVMGSDLVEKGVSNPPATVQVGSSFSVTDEVKNQGDTDAGASTTQYYLSLDTKKSPDDKLLTGSRFVPGLVVGASSTGTVNVTVPSDTPLATYYLLACSDDTKVVDETNEKNNCIASGTKVQITQ